MSAVEAIQRAAAERMRRRHDAIETMCERMLLLPGDYGVLVEDGPLGSFRVSLSHDVPPMTVGYMEVSGL